MDHVLGRRDPCGWFGEFILRLKQKQITDIEEGYSREVVVSLFGI